MKRIVVLALFLTVLFPAHAAVLRDDAGSTSTNDLALAKQIQADPTLSSVHKLARALLQSGLNAGSGYEEVWIRDLNTFIEVALEVNEPARFRQALLMFFNFQGADGDMVDGYIPENRANVGYKYRKSNLAQGLLAHLNTVETDQESSLVQAVHKYVQATGDRSILQEPIQGVTVRDRLGRALDYVRQNRWDTGHGLVWGATTADWGDVQPESPWGVELDDRSHRSLDIYDNAMMVIAIGDYLDLIGQAAPESFRWRSIAADLKSNIRRHLWDEKRQKFIPHLYLDGSPFPKDFDEGAIYYHGGTAVAIEAGLLNPAEVKRSLEQMTANVRASGAASIGLTVFPPYPAGFFKNPQMSQPFSYQNGGDWCWFGGRMIQQLIRQGLTAEAYRELKPMLERVQRHGFHEWWSRENEPRGSGQFRGSAGVLGRAIELLEEWATAQNQEKLTLKAEDLRIRTVGRVTQGGWNLYSEGEAGDRILLAADGVYRLTVGAWGSPCQGIWPEMALLLDGEQVRKISVESDRLGNYEFRFAIKAGSHQLTLAFLNDAVTKDEDRNLYLGTIELASVSGGAKPSLATPDQVAADAARLENEALAESDAGIERFRKGDVIVHVVDANGKPIPHAQVTLEQTRHEFLFGCNIYGFDQFETLDASEEYKRRFADLFNYATVGFYWRWYEPVQGKPEYSRTDKVVAWCRDRQIRVKGHPLLWSDEAGIPTWSTGQPSPEMQQTRVRTIMQRYQGRIEVWEVVNEPSHLPGLAIDAPYRWAREADPTATLVINDYYVMADGHPPFFRLLEQAIQNGVPFDGIGIQAHEPRATRFPLARVKRVLDHYASLGKGIHITEFTPPSAGQAIAGSNQAGAWDEAAQADYAVKFYRVCFAHPAMIAITWWDLCDAHSWLKGGGMLRADLTPKPVYTALHELIQDRRHTHADGITDASGRFTTRGFFGNYNVLVKNGPRQLTGSLHLTKNGPSETELRFSVQ